MPSGSFAQQPPFGGPPFPQQPSFAGASFPQQPGSGVYPSPQQPLRLSRSGRRGPGIIVGVTVLALVAGGYVALGQPEKHDVTGQLSLYDSSSFYGKSAGSSCSGDGGYGDVEYGAQVVVTDEAGTTVATDTLESGSYDGTACVFDFTVHDVPKAKYYRVTTGRASRNGPQYSYDEIRQQHWSVQLTLGT
jgi:hypothetical protein